MIMEARGGLELVVAAALLCPLGWYFVCLSSADCWAENWIPFPAKLETTMNFKRHESSPVQWFDWNCYRFDGTKLFRGSYKISCKHGVSTYSQLICFLGIRGKCSNNSNCYLQPTVRKRLRSSHRV